MKVVILEDNGGISTLLSAVLQGYETVSPKIDRTELFDPELWESADVAVVDLLLGEMKGTEVLAYLGTVAPHVRRIVITAAPAAVDDTCLRESEAILTKPFDITDLCNEVALGRRDA